MMKLLEIVEQDILMDEMNELENEQVERILSNDCLIVENVLYGISREKIDDVFQYKKKFLVSISERDLANKRFPIYCESNRLNKSFLFIRFMTKERRELSFQPV